jgi:hypothetical protein
MAYVLTLLIFNKLWYNYNVKLNVFGPTRGGGIVRRGTRIVSVVLIILLVGPMNALAVGYERYRPAGSVEAQVKAQETCDWWGSLKQGLLVDKYPGLIDEAACAVKDLLSQFGILDKKTP